ncbi:MAG: acylneuraminate cytidylyltransferase family protein [Nanoarchaeota archaeon]|nr:acylneuraminate cytidylyltransferase family protein [Nanoarchaeota archaeon]
MIGGKTVLAIIPARGGSKGVPRKNVKPLGGKPLISYMINAAKKSRYVDRVVVSTEDKEIADVAKEYGAEVPFIRPMELALDTTAMEPVIQHAVRWLEKNEKYEPEIVVTLQCTTPLTEKEDIDKVIKKLIDTNADAVYTVCESGYCAYLMQKIEGDKIYFIKDPTNDLAQHSAVYRQGLPKTYQVNGAINATKRYVLMKREDPGFGLNVPKKGEDTRAVIMSKIKSVDVDTLLDFKLAELLVNEKNEGNTI